MQAIVAGPIKRPRKSPLEVNGSACPLLRAIVVWEIWRMINNLYYVIDLFSV